MSAGRSAGDAAPTRSAAAGSAFVRIPRAVLGLIAATALLFIMALTFVDVLMRYWFSSPITGSAELVMFAMAILIFSILPIITFDEQHISVGLLKGRFTGALAWLQRAIVLAVSLVASAAMTWQLLVDGAQSSADHRTTTVLSLPQGPLEYAMGALSGIGSLALLYMLAMHVLDREAHPPRNAP